MKKFILFGLMAAMSIAVSCSDVTPESESSDNSELVIKINGSTATRSTVAPTTANDEKINTWGVFVFDNNDAGKILVAGNRNIDGNLTSVSMKIKRYESLTVYALANVTLTAEQCKDLATFEANICDLKNEKMDSFAMVGCTQTATDTDTKTVSLSLRRMVARVHLQSLNVNFDNNPRLDGKSISDIQIYIKNAPTKSAVKMSEDGKVYSQNGISDENGSSFSHTGYMIEDCLGTTDALTVNDNASLSNHYFHCYQKDFDTNPDSADTPVRFIIKGKLDGKVQYWGFNINTSGKGHNSGKYGITANNIYMLNVTIRNWGSDNEDEDPAYTDLTADITVADWTEHGPFGIEY